MGQGLLLKDKELVKEVTRPSFLVIAATRLGAFMVFRNCGRHPLEIPIEAKEEADLTLC